MQMPAQPMPQREAYFKLVFGEVRLEVSAGIGKGESGGGPPHSKTLTRVPIPSEKREASWSAPVLWRFAMTAAFHRTLFAEGCD
jgi:hypothetical protein